MTRDYAILPCNGLDRSFGQVARAAALLFQQNNGGEIVCPVLLHRAPARYADIVKRLPLLVIDGCATGCASRLAAEEGLKVVQKVQVAEVAKRAGISVGKSLTNDEGWAALSEAVLGEVRADVATSGSSGAATEFAAPVEYSSFTHDKFLFRVPKEGFLFNENDCWVRVSGNLARVGISDFMQQSLADVNSCYLPEIGAHIEQFGEAGTIESLKAAFEVVSPVSGRVVAVNTELETNPELVNQDPYERGWVTELELTDFANERDLLLDCSAYLELAQRKAADFRP